ncbi:MAG: enoyl-CoA hydratase [Deinococcales bacterium]|nr:enoyl-CoA hydratase [Deinococcales bacterium]
MAGEATAAGERAYEHVRVERLEGGVGLLRIDRSERRNALNQATLQELAEAARAFDRDEAVGCLVITGDERAFAAGADVTEMDGKGVPDMLGAYRFESWEALARVRKPIVAAVSGYALGGGLELAMLCDMIVASESAKLGQPEIDLGIMPGAGGTQRLTRQLGKYLAMEVILAGRLLTAQEALQHGLVNRVVPVEGYLESALELARAVAARAPQAVRLAKSAVNRAQGPLQEGLEFERNAFYLLFGTEDQKEGVRAFLEKREPRWRGR